MQTEQELFANGLATYQKVVSLNYMAHREVCDVLRRALATEAPNQFVFLDIACGAATASAEALKGTNVGRYIGSTFRSHHSTWPRMRSETWVVQLTSAVRTSSEQSTHGTNRSM
jgi:hypothetical protein